MVNIKTFYHYFISQDGVLIRENDSGVEAFIDCKWVYPETSLGYQMPIEPDVVHQLICKSLKRCYDENPDYRGKHASGC